MLWKKKCQKVKYKSQPFMLCVEWLYVSVILYGCSQFFFGSYCHCPSHGSTWNKSSLDDRTTNIHLHSQSHLLQRILELPVTRTCMSLSCGRNLELSKMNPESPNTGNQTCVMSVCKYILSVCLAHSLTHNNHSSVVIMLIQNDFNVHYNLCWCFTKL